MPVVRRPAGQGSGGGNEQDDGCGDREPAVTAPAGALSPPLELPPGLVHFSPPPGLPPGPVHVSPVAVLLSPRRSARVPGGGIREPRHCLAQVCRGGVRVANPASPPEPGKCLLGQAPGDRPVTGQPQRRLH